MATATRARAADLETAAPETPLTAEAAADQAGSRLSAALPGFDPTIIITLITAILKALGVCKNDGPAAVKKIAARGGVLARGRLRRAIHEQGAPLTWSETNTAVEAVLEMGASASVEEIRAFCQCCD